MKCIVTGAAGFVGSTLVDRLLRDGCIVTGIDCFVDYYPKELKLQNIQGSIKNPNYNFIEMDINKVDWSSTLDGVEWIFHQAAQAGVRASWGQSFEPYTHHNILGTQRILEAVKGSKTLKKIVYASSSSVYGNAETFPTLESVTPAPISPYGVTKLAAEHLMCLYASEFGVPSTSLRYFTVFGPRQRPDMAFHRFIRAALSKEPITLYGDGEQARDFTFIDDIVEANIQAAEKATNGSVFNIGGGTNATVNDVLSILKKEIGDLNIVTYDRQYGDARKTSANTTKAKTMLGFDPKVSLVDGISAEIDWLRSIVK